MNSSLPTTESPATAGVALLQLQLLVAKVLASAAAAGEQPQQGDHGLHHQQAASYIMPADPAAPSAAAGAAGAGRAQQAASSSMPTPAALPAAAAAGDTLGDEASQMDTALDAAGGAVHAQQWLSRITTWGRKKMAACFTAN